MLRLLRLQQSQELLVGPEVDGAAERNPRNARAYSGEERGGALLGVHATKSVEPAYRKKWG